LSHLLPITAAAQRMGSAERHRRSADSKANSRGELDDLVCFATKPTSDPAMPAQQGTRRLHRMTGQFARR